jgi:hypothetical protein
MRASDGATVFTFDVQNYVRYTVVPILWPFSVISIEQSGLLFDGQNIWVGVNINGFPLVILKVRGSDGSPQSYLNLLPLVVHGGSFLADIAFDGKYIWAAVGGTDHVLGKYRASDAAIQAEFFITGNATSLAFDGANLWAVGADTGTVSRINAGTNSISTFNVGSGNQSTPSGVAFDGTSMWISASSDNTVMKMALDGSVLGTFSVGSGPKSLVFDGANIWVGNAGSNSVTKLRASDGSLLGTFNVSGSPTALVFDGVNIWVGTSANTLDKL